MCESTCRLCPSPIPATTRPLRQSQGVAFPHGDAEAAASYHIVDPQLLALRASRIAAHAVVVDQQVEGAISHHALDATGHIHAQVVPTRGTVNGSENLETANNPRSRSSAVQPQSRDRFFPETVSVQ